MEDVIRVLKRNDLYSVAKIHKNIFSDHFLGQLPVSLIRCFYESFYKEIENQEGVFLVYELRNNILGFVLGGHSNKLNDAKRKFIKKNFLMLSLHIVLNLKTYPFIWQKLFLSRHDLMMNAKFPQPDFRLLSIGVCQDVKGKGIACELVREYEKAACLLSNAYGLSVHKNNKRALCFYKKMDLAINGEQGDSYYMIKQLNK